MSVTDVNPFIPIPRPRLAAAVNTLPRVWLAVTVVWLGDGANAAGMPNPATFFSSKMIPKRGDRLSVGLILDGKAMTTSPAFTVELRDASPGRAPLVVGRQTVQRRPASTEPLRVSFRWQPKANDWHTLIFSLSPSPTDSGKSDELRVRVPVVDRDLYFAWFGSPTAFRWCNVPTTVKEKEEERLWLLRGAWPCHWKGGVCYKQWPLERFVESYAAHKWIAVDEVGGPGPVTDTIVAALRAHKRRHPDGFIAVWFMGAHEYWRDIADTVDLFLPEVYLNYRGNHLGQFAPYLRTARETGVIDRLVPALGINIVKDEKTGEVCASPTRQDVLRQIRHLKRIAPDCPGVAFFTSNSAAPGVAEYADNLCEQYYLDPVLSVFNLRVRTEDGVARATASIRNVGGTPARDVRWQARWLDSPGAANAAQRAASGVTPWVGAGHETRIDFPVQPSAGVHVLELSLVPQAGVTLLDDAATRAVASLRELANPRAAVLSLPPAAYNRRNVTTSLPWPAGSWTVSEIGPAGRIIGEPRFAVRPAVPGSQDTRLTIAAAGLTPTGARRCFLVRRGDQEAPPVQRLQMEPIVIQRDTYRAEVDPGRDALVSLLVGERQTELLKAPWVFRRPGPDGIRPAVVMESPLGTEVVIGFETAELTGATRYTFFHHGSLIEISRRIAPKHRLTLRGVNEGCALSQRGGTFALQAGVGGPVQRGELRDGKTYRDLLFGYLGERPRPDNADKCGWFDFSWPHEYDAGLGVVVARRWRDAATKSYDVTRYYDAADWVQVNYVWGVEIAIDRPQESVVYLAPHGFIDLADAETIGPAQSTWDTLHGGIELADAGM